MAISRCTSRREPAFRCVMSRPSKVIAPSVGSISRLMLRSSVDLPAPEGPMIVMNSPGSAAKFTPDSAAAVPALAPRRRAS